MTSGPNHLFERFQCEGSRCDYERLVETYRPLVHSVCRRFLRNPPDVEDASQETFLKFARHRQTIQGSVGGWLSSTASAASLDLIRRALRERRRIEVAHQIRAGAVDVEHRLMHEAIRARLNEALLSLDAPDRELIAERFFRKVPLRVIAERETKSVATISRRVNAALGALAAVLRDMGIAAADDLTLAEHFGDPGNVPVEIDAHDPLRFAPDWRAAAHRPSDATFAGWSRPLRVGVMVSYMTMAKPTATGILLTPECQVLTAGLIVRPGIQLIGIVEPGSSAYGGVERLLRDWDLIGGLIDASDEAALRTLDVIVLGVNWFMEPPVAAALHGAVSRGGVGLLNEWWTGSHEMAWGNVHLRELMLSDSPVYGFHMPSCGTWVSATVLEEHPLLHNAKTGATFMTNGCGPVFRPMLGTRVLIAKDRVVMPDEHRIPGLGPAKMPVCAVGQVGKGRVMVANVHRESLLSDLVGVSGEEHLASVIRWLAEPQRGEALS
jgi:RNA polymerase sigma factor (sigma-70 family)